MSNSKTPPTGKYDGNQPGATHAPGVLCYIKVPQAVDSLIGLIDALLGDPPTTSDNGKVVKLNQLLTAGMRYTCKVCRNSAILPAGISPLWEVEGLTELTSSGAMSCDPKIGLFKQQHLIPIGAPGLASGEDTETSKSLEDSTAGLADAASGLLSLTIRRIPATPATNK